MPGAGTEQQREPNTQLTAKLGTCLVHANKELLCPDQLSQASWSHEAKDNTKICQAIEMVIWPKDAKSLLRQPNVCPLHWD